MGYNSLDIFEKAIRWEEDYTDLTHLTLHASLQSYSYVLKGADPTGPITSASVTLTGPLLQATLESDGDLAVHGQARIGNFVFSPDYDFSMPGEHCIESGAALWCLQLVSLRVPVDRPVYHYLWCLILRRIEVDVDDKGAYERVGLLRYREDVSLPVDKWFDPACVEKDASVKIL